MPARAELFRNPEVEDQIELHYLFPGQGSQEPGMAKELIEGSPAARMIIAEASDILHVDLPRLISEATPETLRDTSISQPLIFTTSVASLAAFGEATEGKMWQAKDTAGHSLGEYTALYAAGVLPFRENLLLVQKRGNLMKQASRKREGGMIAVLGSLDDLTIEHILAETGVELANVNSDDQIVFSGNKKSVAQAVDLSMSRGAKKVIPLPVAGAFHSSLMKLAQPELIEYISGMDFNDPKIPIFANSTAEPLTTATDVKNELVQGLCQTVKWRDSFKNMTHEGMQAGRKILVVEFGAGRTLTSLAKRIEKGVGVFNVSSPESARELASRFAS